MRKYLYLTMAAASAAVLAAPIVAEAAPAAASHVLTITKTHGNAVKVGATLKASLAKGTSATFAFGALGSLSCKQSSFTAIVVKNPTKGAKATKAIEALKSESMGKCTATLKGLTVRKITPLNLPYVSTVSDGKGFPVTVAGRTKTKPVELTSTVVFSNTPITCTYKSTGINGSASNKGNTITIVKQKFTVVKGSNGICPATANFSAKFGPVVDSSVKRSPKVFVN